VVSVPERRIDFALVARDQIICITGCLSDVLFRVSREDLFVLFERGPRKNDFSVEIVAIIFERVTGLTRGISASVLNIYVREVRVIAASAFRRISSFRGITNSAYCLRVNKMPEFISIHHLFTYNLKRGSAFRRFDLSDSDSGRVRLHSPRNYFLLIFTHPTFAPFKDSTPD
jgi:hypothetical protein